MSRENRNVHNSIIHNSQKWKHQIPITFIQENVIHPYNGIYLAIKELKYLTRDTKMDDL